MAKPVRSIKRFNWPCLRVSWCVPILFSTFGNSLAGSVESVKRLLPDLTATLFSLALNLISLPSGSDLQISNNFRAGTVTSPDSSPATASCMRPTSSTSKSVPVSDSQSSFSTSNTFAKIGNVCLRSTTPATRFNDLTRLSREILNFILVFSLP